jgi:hypothetical protein
MKTRPNQLALAAAAAATIVLPLPAFAGSIRHDVNDANYLGLGLDPRYASVDLVSF